MHTAVLPIQPDLRLSTAPLSPPVSTEISPPASVTIPARITRRVLTVGLEHQNHRGGIGGVIDTYARYFASFQFVATYPTHPRKWTLPLYFARNYVRLLNQLWRDPDLRIVHIHGAANGSFVRKYLVFLAAKYLFGRRVIYHSHGSEFKVFYHKSPPVVKRLIHHFMEKTDAIICLSTAWEAFFQTHFQPRKLVVLGNVVEPPAGEIVRDVPACRPLRLLFLGLIGNRKGIFDLLDVIREHREQFRGRLHLTVGGNGDSKRLIDFIGQHQLDHLIHYAGWVSGETKQQLLRDSDAYILPSYNEGLPLSILEAMSYQLPIISTPVGGTAEIVHDGVNGYLVPPGDKQALADRLLYLIRQPERVTSMGAKSGQLVRQYVPEVIFPQLQSLYEYLLSEPG